MIILDQNIPDTSLISYYNLTDKPFINGVMIDGSLSLNDLGITSKNEFENYKSLLQTELSSLQGSKQSKLISGENIKTVNGQTILGNGNLSIEVPVTSVNGMIGDVVIDVPSLIPSNYITEDELNNRHYLTEVPSNYITEDELDARHYISEIPANYITYDKLYAEDYASKEYVRIKDDLLNRDIQDVSTRLFNDYFTRDEFNEKQDEFVLKNEVQDFLSGTSTLPVQNKIVTQQINTVNDRISGVATSINNLSSSVTRVENDIQDVSTRVNENYTRLLGGIESVFGTLQEDITNIENNLETITGDSSISIEELNNNKISVGDASLSTENQVFKIQVMTISEYENLVDEDPHVMYVLK